MESTVPQLVGFSLQQGVAFVFAAIVAVAQSWALVKLFLVAREERERAQAARDSDRVALTGILDTIRIAVADNAKATTDNTRALERLTDRVLTRPERAA